MTRAHYIAPGAEESGTAARLGNLLVRDDRSRTQPDPEPIVTPTWDLN